jgi:hypothetical protein
VPVIGAVVDGNEVVVVHDRSGRVFLSNRADVFGEQLAVIGFIGRIEDLEVTVGKMDGHIAESFGVIENICKLGGVKRNDENGVIVNFFNVVNALVIAVVARIPSVIGTLTGDHIGEVVKYFVAEKIDRSIGNFADSKNMKKVSSIFNFIIAPIAYYNGIAMIVNQKRNRITFPLFDGKVIGEIEGNITIKHIPLLKQVLCGCHTEKGLDLNTNYYNISSLSEAKNKNELPKELKYIESQNGELTQSILNFTLKQNSFSYKELNNHLTEVLKTFIIPLNYKDKEGHYRYEIKTEYGRLKAPEILLNVGLTIINSMDGFNKEQRQICFEDSECEA